ncbi:MAG: DNA polymerase I [Thiotrichales bacterium]|nr:DNA polymerase I [Thiotrichales bacterium]
MSTTPRRLVLVDGSSYLYRAFHAMPSLTNSKGQPTGAAYGMTNMLKRLEAEVQPELAAVIFDAKGKTFRDDLYPEYKANRPPMPTELRSQIESIHAIVGALGFPVLVEAGVEADDVIGTLAEQAGTAGLEVLVCTGDKDMAQLVGDRVTMVNTMDDPVLDAAGVASKFGVPPESIVDYLALVGDTVDNVPGVPKVGPKTASKWLAQYGTLENLVAHAGEIKGKVGESLRASLGQIPLSKELVTIRRDVPLKVGPLDLELVEPDVEALKTLYGELEFRTWLGELLDAGGDAPAEAPAAEYETVLDEAALDAWIERLGAADAIAFDTETTSLDYMQADLVGVSFAVEPGHAAYVPFGHDYPGAPAQLAPEVVLGKLRPILESERPAKIGQNLKYDMSVLARAGIRLAGVAFDTMLESYVLDSTATRHDMDSLALKYLGHRTIHYEDIAGKGAKQLSFNRIPVEDAGPYAAEDADVTLRLHRVLRPRLEGHAPLKRLCDTMEIPLVPVLSRMERNGVRIDVRRLKQQSAELADRMRALEASAHESAGGPFNLGSAKQIRAILFDKLGLPVLAKTPKGQPSTAESVLQELAFDHALPKLILEHRAVTKLKSTYTDALPDCVNPATGRVHTSYHQAVAATGRLSSSEPNLQNIPVRTHEGRRVRQAFVADPGFRMVAADYSQIELRIMAHLSGDRGLLDAFASGADIHRATAAEVFAGGADGAVTDEQRRRAKAINFGLIYGMSAFGLARQLGIERGEAQRYVDLYFSRYPGVKAFMDATRESARDQGYVQTVFGRRLYLPEIKSSNIHRRQYAERTAINAPMQGTAADIIKRAMLSLDAWIAESGAPVRMIMQVHDELVFEVANDAVGDVTPIIRERMSAAADLSVPLMVDIGTGDHWDEAH